jgi:NTE family protein
MTTSAAAPQGPIRLSLALQGGGAHGAYEWGVLDRLLEESDIEIAAVSAASAGAMNAVALAGGMTQGGRDGARTALAAFWKGVNQAGNRNVFGDTGFFNALISPEWLSNSPGWRWAEAWASTLSPYEFNPFNLNPLREVLERRVDFAAVRERSAVRLFVAATQVRTSEVRIFRETELTALHVMASACLPYLFQAVSIAGEDYWDGGYLANPPLFPLFEGDGPEDVLIVSLNPFVREQTPRKPAEIMDRLNEITFNASLAAELRSVALVQKLIEEGALTPARRGRYRRMRLHAIGADGRLDDLSLGSKFNTEWSFLTDLKVRGRTAAEAWLAAHRGGLGVEGTLDLKRFLP